MSYEYVYYNLNNIVLAGGEVYCICQGRPL